MTELTEEQLARIEELSAALMTIKEICIIEQLSFDQYHHLFLDPTHPIYQAHQKGMLLTKVSVQQKIIALATAGSSPAQSQAVKLLADKEITDGYN